MTENEYKATINYGGNEFFIGISPSGHAVTLDVNHDRNSGPTPMELVLMAVGACTAVDVVSILEKKRQKVTNYRVEVRGERREEHPRAFTRLKIHHIVYGKNISEEAVKRSIELSDTKYCSVSASLRPGAEIITSYEIIESSE
jgi:putative redox protein